MATVNSLTAVKVLQYNILSAALAEPDHFPKNRPEDLDGGVRLERVKAKLAKAISQNTVIALQEVCLAWSGPLQAFFSAHNYQFHCSLYGSKFSDFMGVALAWPASGFDCLSCDVCCLADTKPTPWVKAATPAAPEVSCFSGILQRCGLVATATPATIFDPWAEAARRQNRLILARLRSKTGGAPPFVIATYHMPCLFGSAPKVQVMNIHAALAVQRLHGVANGEPSILLGDFNFKPQDSPYKLLTTGTLPEDEAERPVPLAGDSWTVCPLPIRMRSAYQVAQGSEPEFTNHAQSAWDGKLGDPFVETLDYIFISDHWKVDSVVPLPKIDGFPGPLPNKDEPSDHIALGATLIPLLAFAKHSSVPKPGSQ